jgi:hypothetical protein
VTVEETGRQEQLRAYNEYLYQTKADERSGSSSPRREVGESQRCMTCVSADRCAASVWMN